VDCYTLVFDRLRAATLSFDDSVQLIERLGGDLEVVPATRGGARGDPG
jgi:hypothetical protein